MVQKITLKNPAQQAALDGVLKKIGPLKDEFKSILNNEVPVEEASMMPIPDSPRLSEMSRKKMFTVIEDIERKLHIIEGALHASRNPLTVLHEKTVLELQEASNLAYEKMKILFDTK